MKKKQFTSLKINSTMDQLEYIKSLKDKRSSGEFNQTNHVTNASRAFIKGIALSPYKKENSLINGNIPVTTSNATKICTIFKRDPSINERKVVYTSNNNNCLNSFVTEGNKIKSYYHKSKFDY